MEKRLSIDKELRILWKLCLGLEENVKSVKKYVKRVETARYQQKNTQPQAKEIVALTRKQFRRDQPLERMPEETNKLTKEDFDIKDSFDIKIDPETVTPTDMESKAEMDKLARELVESLQNGEREETQKLVDDNKEIADIIFEVCRWVDESDGEIESKALASAITNIKDLLSQSKKEGENDYEIGFNDGWNTCCRENNIENDARILYLRRKENINRFKESLTNQKKVI